MNKEKELENKLDKVEEERRRYLLEEDYRKYWKKKVEESKFSIKPKKVYLPDMNSLYKMQDMGANMYNYLLIKAGEALIIDGINHPYKGIENDANRNFDTNNPELITFLLKKYLPDDYNYLPTNEPSKLKYCLAQEISKKLNSIYRVLIINKNN